MDRFETIRKYKELLDEGIITQQEFDTKKEEILNNSNDTESENISKNNKKSIGLDRIINVKKEEPSQEDTALSDKEKEVEEKNRLYENALEKLEKKSSADHKDAITVLKGLGDWKDALNIIEKSNEELLIIEKEEEERRIEKAKIRADNVAKFKKITKRVLIIAIPIIIAILIIIMIIDMNKPNLNAYSGLIKDNVHGLDYEVPKEWKKENSPNPEVVHRYSLSEKGEIIAVFDVSYVGESDLSSGDASYLNNSVDISGVKSLIKYTDNEYATKDASNSLFRVEVYYIKGKVKGTEKIIELIKNSFKIDTYKNPRILKSITAEYTGDTEAGTKLDSSNNKILVTEEFDTVLGTGTKNPAWNIETPAELVAGETSTVTISTTDGQTVDLSVTCTTLTADQYMSQCGIFDYKELLRAENKDNYIKIYGKVLQDCGSGTYRISSDGAYNDVFLVTVSDNTLVEDDWVTVYGVTAGIYSYKTVMGATQRIPAIAAKYTVL